MLKVLDLFSGIGGFSLGLERTGGFETVAFCEIEEYPRKVLAKHWPDVPIHRDVRELDGNDFKGTNIICGGYPCQPFSHAGERKGEEDDRHLWPEVHRLMATVRPRWGLFENVAGHITMGLDQVLSDLESEGYTSQAIVIPACATDAPHRRDRVWIIAHANSHGQPDGPLDEQRVSAVAYPLRFGRNDGPRGGDRQGKDIDSGKEAIGGRGVAFDETYHNTGKFHCWVPEPPVGRVAHGVPRRVDRLKGLGNAVVPQVVTMIGNAILEAEKQCKHARPPP